MSKREHPAPGVRGQGRRPSPERRREQGVRVTAGRIRREEGRHTGRALRRLRALARATGGSRGPGAPRGHLHVPARFLQRSIVKVSYSRNGRSQGWYAHGRYLARPGAQRENERGLGFDAKSDDVHVAQRLNRWQGQGDPRLWKVMVSPERGHDLDLRAHARELADHIERDLGRRLEWVAIDHKDTPHPHVHLLIRGVDRERRPFLIPREYVRSGIRRRSQELATRELGLRRERELSRDLAARVAFQRKITLDRSWQSAESHARRHRPRKQRDRGPDRDRILERPRSVPIRSGPPWD
jgi:type IV secretory pathway VirD2 relaxase